ncbi:ATP-dependent DNA helicase RecG [Pelomicrobium sp. G1]|uniref:ATP-dependent DNA helicase RecG n=1 Tax=unclassified Pelomicrobium TaxID=2815318 RepID=UPI003F75D344
MDTGPPGTPDGGEGAAPTPAPGASHPVFAELSPAIAGRLARLGIQTPFDLALHLPLRYEDETRIVPIAEARDGAPVQVEGVVVSNEIVYRPRRQLVVRVSDGSGELTVRYLHFYPNQVRALAVGKRLRLHGELRSGFLAPEMVHPRARVVAPGEPLPTTLTPVYPTTAGLTQPVLRRLIGRCLAELAFSDTLPPSLKAAHRLPDFEASVRFLHAPPPGADEGALAERTHPAWRRIKFDELLAQQLSMRLHYRERRARVAPRLPARGTLTRRLIESLPFRLTRAQETAFAEISRDMGEAHPMQRLLQGDVGSGKTIVAALAALQAAESGHQTAVMAPTEILAEQHYRKFAQWLEPLGVKVVWLAGGQKKRARDETLAQVAEGKALVAVGTHALFQEEVRFQRLGLAVIDEQHRFGVHQRLALRLKGDHPHQLMMSATPIPRTLAMSYYADLDVSVIAELPPGRAPVATRLVADTRRDEVIARVRADCLAGRQAYWVCPLIEESEALQLKTALETFERLKSTFPELKVGLVHGRLKPEDKARVMEAFQRGEIQLLVATTVIEVGVDVPNASLMVIDHAERLGLSQLHQLRGRVGRGAEKSACILLYGTPLSGAARERLRVMYQVSDGFEIARHDLRLRGPGEFLGARQSGVPLLRFADLERDQDLLEAAREAAREMLERFPDHARRHLERWMGLRHHYLKV